MWRKAALAVVLVLVIAGIVTGIKVMQFRSMIEAGKSFTMPPETVSSATVRRVAWESIDSAIGTVRAAQGVTIRAELQGVVEKIAFESGAFVREGDVLLELDHDMEDAQLKSAVARAELARSNLSRARDLSEQEIMARSSLDASEAEAKEASAQAEWTRATIAKKVIRAPFSGRVGIRQVQLGQYVDAGTSIVSLQALDPVHVDFSLPERLAGTVRAGMAVRVTTDSIPGRAFEGTLTAIDPQVDPSSRSLRLQATLANPDGTLIPGAFARVELVKPEIMDLLVVPVTAVLKAPYGDTVFVLEEKKDETSGQVGLRARLVNVEVGPTRGDLVAIVRGIEEGQQVATSGVFKLRNDAAVVINNELEPVPEAEPHPKES